MARYAHGGYVPGPPATSWISPCETLINSDGTVTRHGVVIGHMDMARIAREVLSQVNRGTR